MKLTLPVSARVLRCSLTAAMLFCQPLATVCRAGDADVQPKSIARDVRLQPDGLLQIRIVDGNGTPVERQTVQIRFGDKTIARATTDSAGIVAFTKLRPGLHVIAAPHGTGAFRFWNADDAPPTALQTPAVVSDTNTVRGQMMYGPSPGVLVAGGLSIAALVVALDASSDADKAISRTQDLSARVDALEPASP